MDELNTTQNGDGFFNVDWLTNLIAPFEFEFEGHKLRGSWYRYKTTTPDWIQNFVVDSRNAIEEYRDLAEKIRLSQDQKEVALMRKRQDEIETAGTRAKYAWLSSAIVSWNAVGKDKQPLPINEAVFNSIPVPFLIALGDHLANSRTGQNPT